MSGMTAVPIIGQSPVSSIQIVLCTESVSEDDIYDVGPCSAEESTNQIVYFDSRTFFFF